MPLLRLGMKVSDTSLQGFVELYSKKYGVLLDKEEVMDIAVRFLRLIEVVESKFFYK